MRYVVPMGVFILVLSALGVTCSIKPAPAGDRSDRLERIEAGVLDIIERLKRLEARAPLPHLDGFVTEVRDGRVVRIPADIATELRLEYQIGAEIPDKPALGPKHSVLEKPAPMIGPAGNGRTRQEVLDAIPKGDRMYNFKAIEWDAINMDDAEWREEYGTDPEVKRP